MIRPGLCCISLSLQERDPPVKFQTMTCARFVLPLATPTRLYMSGSIRSWITYIQLRSGNGTQKEHMIIANNCKNIFIQQFPIISEALGWK